MKKSQWYRSVNKKLQQSGALYLYAALIPAVLLSIIHVYYRAGYGNPLMGTLQLHEILFNALASVCFLFYLRNTARFSLPSDIRQLVFAVSYGMCSYGLVQESYLPALCLYAICPLVFAAAQLMWEGHRYLHLIVMLAFALAIFPAGALPLFLLLLLMTPVELHLSGRLTPGNLVHNAGCLLFSFLLSSFRILPYLESMYSASPYHGFSFTYTPLMLLSRLMPFTAPSISFNAVYGADLYFGLFALLPLTLFFFSSKISAAKKLAYGFFALLLAGAVTISPLRHLMSFGISDGRYSVFFSFLLIFWLLRLAAEGASHFGDASKAEKGISFAVVSLIMLAGYAGFSHNFPAFAFPVTIVLLVCSGVLVCFSNAPKYQRSASVLLLVLLAAELTGNAFVQSDLNLLPQKRALSASYVWAAQPEGSKAENPVEDSEIAPDVSAESDASTARTEAGSDAYEEFMAVHTDEADLEFIDALYEAVRLDNSEYEKYCGTSLPDNFEYINGLAHKLGVQDDLFVPAAVTVTFEDSSDYSVSPLADSLYYLFGDQSDGRAEQYCAPFRIELLEEVSDALYISNDMTGEVFSFTKEQQTGSMTAYTILANNDNNGFTFRLLAYSLNRSAFQKVAKPLRDALVVYSEEEEAASAARSHRWIYVGIGLSALGLLLFLSLYFNSDKQKVYDVLLRIKQWIDDRKLPHTFSVHLSENRMYYAGFFVPFFLFLIVMVITDCPPFGTSALFDEDGISLTLPSYMDCLYNLKGGNMYLSMHGGYSYSLYANHPLIQVMSFYRLFGADQIPALLLLGEGICLGLCGLSMAYYMTHRLLGGRVKKTDYRLLAPILIYSFNAYMIAMHNFTGWYYTLFAFPLLMTAMDYLLYKKKTLPYVLLLTYCIATNLYLALYMCIFLVIYFFTCYYKSFKDFVRKGIRFVLCSLLAAGNAFFIIASTLLSSADSPYRDNDSILPSLGLHTSFLEQWKKHMIFTTAHSVSADNGMVNIYCGILLLFLLLLYMSSKTVSIRAKLRKLVPLVILYVSFNGKVLSYLWNGLHYQSKVPNRYVFLLMFLLAELSYDAIRQIKNTSAVRFACITGIACGFLLLCQLGSSGNSSFSFAGSLIVCAVYLLCHLLLAKRSPQQYTKVVVFLLAAELCVNAVYTYCHFGLATISIFGDSSATAAYMEAQREKSDEYFRTTFAAPRSGLINTGMYYNTDSPALFNSFVNAHQTHLNILMGFYSGGNNMMNRHNSSPMGMSLAGIRYLFLPYTSSCRLEGLEQYEYLGRQDIFYVFENPKALSLGIYVPEEAAALKEHVAYPTDFYNALAGLYSTEDTPVFTNQEISYNEDVSAENTFCFVDASGQQLSLDEATEICHDTSDQGERRRSGLKLRFHYTPEATGYSYFFANELIGTGFAEAGEETVAEVAWPNSSADISTQYTLFTMNEARFNAFYQTAQENQMMQIQAKNDTITGQTDYAEDGYTMLSVAYDKGWHAYIDGEEVEIEDPCYAMMFVKTPAGKHTLSLKYIPYRMKESKGISFAFWLLTACIYGIRSLMKKKRVKKEKNRLTPA
ncbi:MAG: YfhO family protein [Lachnospiraceae bacterium]|nr:YfhO family protein [Lachnospiraceae bacterium]